jgi:hypothetical protein
MMIPAVIYITRKRDYWKKGKLLLRLPTTNSPNRTLMKGVGTVMMRPPTINNILPLPPTVHTPQDVVILFHPILIQGLPECLLSTPHPMLLLHLLKEIRGMEPQHLLGILGSAPLLGNPSLPTVRSVQILHPHLT